MNVLMTLVVGAIGGILIWRAKVPGGMIIGAIVAVSALNICTETAYLWPQAKVLAQSFTGAYIGCMMTHDALKNLRRVVGPYIVVMCTFFALNLTVGRFIYNTTDLDLLTSLLCSMPGGMSDTPLIALDMGADSSSVAVMQFVRMIFGLSCLPSIIMYANRRRRSKEEDGPCKRITHNTKSTIKKHEPPLRPFLPTLFLAGIAGGIGKMTGIPAGAMAFSLILVSFLRVKGKTPPIPRYLRQAAQIISGCCIGCTVSLEQLTVFKQLLIPAIVICVSYIVVCIGMGTFISKMFHVERREAMLFLSPAGATEMALIAADLGVESTNLAILQICRLIGVMLVFPQLFAFITSL